MSSHDSVLFLVQLSVMLAVALLFGQIARKLRQPAILGELIGGVLLGPTFLGSVAPDWYHELFPGNHLSQANLETVLNLGMVFFLFAAGLEVDLVQLFQHKKKIVIISTLSVLIPFVLGYSSIFLWPSFWGNFIQGEKQQFAFFFGTALSISAIPVIARILLDLNLLKHDIGQVIIASAALIDLIGWTLFGIFLVAGVPARVTTQSPWLTLTLLIIYILLVLQIGRWLGRNIVPDTQTNPESLPIPIGSTILLIFLVSALAEWLGTHAVFGAFLLGVGVAWGSKKKALAHLLISRFAVSFFAPLYFVSIGLRVNFLENFDLRLVLLTCTIACLGKIVGGGLGAMIGKMNPLHAFAVGISLNARGAIELILAKVALDYQIITPPVFVALTIMALVTSLLPGPILSRLIIPKTNQQHSIPVSSIPAE